VYLLDTDVVSELRKGSRANPGVLAFLSAARSEAVPLYLSVITLGELCQGVERIRHRGDDEQAGRLARWLERVLREFADSILPFDTDCARVWGHLRVPNPENPLDKQMAAIALINDLVVVTRNAAHFRPTGVRLLDPFS
jgi:toxin FitB